MRDLPISRRKFVKQTTAAGSGLLLMPSVAPSIIKNYNQPNSVINGVQIGVITYSFRSMQDQSAEATLQYILDSGISAVELMGGPAESFAGMPENPVDRGLFWRLLRKQRNGESLTREEVEEMAAMRERTEAYNKEVAEWRLKASMKKFEAFRKMYNDAGVSIYGFKPRAFGKDNTDAEINYGFRAAKALGASHVTLEHPSDDGHTAKLGKMAKKHKVYVAYHGHEQQTPTFWDMALKQSKYNMLNADMGHYIAAGNTDPVALLQANHNRISSIHLKDRQTPENGKKNLVWGSGDTPLPAILQTMRDNKYRFPGSIELEYEIPEGSDAVKEVQKCLEFCRKSLA